MTLEEKRSIEEDYQTLLSISQKKGEEHSEIYIYGDGPEIIGGTMMLLEEISQNLEISLGDFCEMLQFLRKQTEDERRKID